MADAAPPRTMSTRAIDWFFPGELGSPGRAWLVERASSVLSEYKKALSLDQSMTASGDDRSL